MTHSSFIRGTIDWDDCRIVRYDNNNGIVLFAESSAPIDRAIMYIDGDDVGVKREDLSDVPFNRAQPIFRTMVEIHNRAWLAAEESGVAQAQHAMRQTLGVTQ